MTTPHTTDSAIALFRTIVEPAQGPFTPEEFQDVLRDITQVQLELVRMCNAPITDARLRTVSFVRLVSFLQGAQIALTAIIGDGIFSTAFAARTHRWSGIVPTRHGPIPEADLAAFRTQLVYGLPRLRAELETISPRSENEAQVALGLTRTIAFVEGAVALTNAALGESAFDVAHACSEYLA